MAKVFNEKLKELREELTPTKTVFEKKVKELRKKIKEKNKGFEKKKVLKKTRKKSSQTKKAGIKASKKSVSKPKKVSVKKIIKSKTGIPGLDKALNGGIPSGNLVVIAGGPGSGKTTFGIQYLYEGAKKYDEPGVFISLEEEPERLISNYEAMGFNITSLIKKKKLVFVKNTLYKLESLIQNITDAIELVNAKRVVIDPGALLSLFFETEIEVRKALVDLANLLKRLKVTSMITMDFHLGKETDFGLEEYAADGVILLYHVKSGNIYERMIAILKMRGTTHSEKLMPFRLAKKGIQIYAEEEVFTKV